MAVWTEEITGKYIVEEGGGRDASSGTEVGPSCFTNRHCVFPGLAEVVPQLGSFFLMYMYESSKTGDFISAPAGNI